MMLPVLIALLAGWLQRHQQQVITYLLEENRVLKAQRGGRRLRLTDTERRAVKRQRAGNALGPLQVALRTLPTLLSSPQWGFSRRYHLCGASRRGLASSGTLPTWPCPALGSLPISGHGAAPPDLSCHRTRTPRPWSEPWGTTATRSRHAPRDPPRTPCHPG